MGTIYFVVFRLLFWKISMVDIGKRGLGRRRDTAAGALHGGLDPAAEGLSVIRTPFLIALGASALSGAISGALVTAIIAWFLCHG
jgi:hypothetical protein